MFPPQNRGQRIVTSAAAERRQAGPWAPEFENEPVVVLEAASEGGVEGQRPRRDASAAQFPRPEPIGNLFAGTSLAPVWDRVQRTAGESEE